MNVILNINNLYYDNVFSNLNISIEDRRLISISGPNNCGKTTLARILDRRISGDFNINFQGRDITSYTLEEYNHKVQVVFPLEIHFKEETLEEEILYYSFNEEKKNYILKMLDLNKTIKKKITKLTTKEIIYYQIALALIKAESIVVIDGIDVYFNKQELNDLYKAFRLCIQRWDTSIVITSVSLDEALLTDELYIIKDKEVLLSGEPIKVLMKDNIINKAGLSIPLMIDLCVKLRDYDLIDKIEMNKERLIDELWK